MKNASLIIVEAAAACALAVSIGLNLCPPAAARGNPAPSGITYPKKTPDEATGSIGHGGATGDVAGSREETPPISTEAQSPEAGEYSSAELATLFGWKPVPASPAVKTVEPGPSPETKPAVREPVSAAWMALVGSVMGDGGRQTYFLKDSRRKQVIRVVEGEENDGYRALAADGKQFLLEREGELYKIEVK